MLQSVFLDRLLDRLWAEYRTRVSYAQRYAQLVSERGGRVVNDHIAFRTFNANLPMQPSGIEAIRRVFEPLGYTQRASYDFPETHLTAIHLDHDDPQRPKLFISQLEVDRLPVDVAARLHTVLHSTATDYAYPHDIIEKLRANALDESQLDDAVTRVASVFRRPWSPPLRSTVLAANSVSQYAAWTLLHGSSVNHFTASINDQNVAEWPDIEATVAGLNAAGVPTKETIEGDRGSKLRQSATKAAEGEFPVSESDGTLGLIPWTYAYYELAERGWVEDEQGAKRLFSGFLGAQTPGLFAMTQLANAG